MDIYLRNTGTTGYLVTGAANDVLQVTSAPGLAVFRSRITIDNINPLTFGTPSDNTIKSHNYVTLKSRDGAFITNHDETSANRLMSDSRIEFPRLGKEIFQIFKVGGNAGDIIGHKDLVWFGIARFPLEPGLWMTHGNPSRSPIFMIETSSPGGAELFEVLVPTEISEFTLPDVAVIPYQGRGGLTGNVRVTGGPGVGLPGGTGFRLEESRETGFIDFGSFIQHVAEDAESGPVEIVLKEHFGSFSPCSTTMVTIRLRPFETQSAFERLLTLRPGRNPFMSMKLEGFQRGGCVFPGVIGILPWPQWYSVQATLFLEPDAVLDQRQSLTILLSSDDLRISELSQQSDQLSPGETISFTFSARKPNTSEKEYCAIISAAFSVEGKPHRPQFAVWSNQRGIVLDPH
jgi:hypothetical protein